MRLLNLIEIFAPLLVLLSMILISVPKRIGLLMGATAQILWIYWGFQTGVLGVSAQSLFLLVFNLLALKNWKSKGIG